jgi:hypothetical protein
MKYKQLIASMALASGVFYANGVEAVTLLTLENPGSVTYQQTLNSPCVIGDPSCVNGALPFTTIPAGQDGYTYNVLSATYQISTLLTILNSSSFMVGIDVNTTTRPLATEYLQYFAMYVNDPLGTTNPVAYFGSATSGPGTQLFTNNNGNGFSDELLKGFDLTGLTGTVTFRAIVNNATDGREEFFLVSSKATPVPEPGTTAMLGAGLIGMGYLARRKQKNFL